jgi:hypothetical protein
MSREASVMRLNVRPQKIAVIDNQPPAHLLTNCAQGWTRRRVRKLLDSQQRT